MKNLLASTLFLLGACGGGGSGPSAEMQAAAQCAALRVRDFGEVFDDVIGLLGALGGELPPGATYEGATGDFSITTTLGAISGNVRSGDDISDGIDPGESASADWSLNPLGGAAVAGSGSFDLDQTSDMLTDVSGDAVIFEDECNFYARPIDLRIDLSSGTWPERGFDFFIVTPDDGPSLGGRVRFDGPDVATVSGDFAGSGGSAFGYVAFTIDLTTFEVDFIQWCDGLSCGP